MSVSVTNRIDPKVDEYLSHVHMWRDEIKKLRSMMLDCGLTEELKWRKLVIWWTTVMSL